MSGDCPSLLFVAALCSGSNVDSSSAFIEHLVDRSFRPIDHVTAITPLEVIPGPRSELSATVGHDCRATQLTRLRQFSGDPDRCVQQNGPNRHDLDPYSVVHAEDSDKALKVSGSYTQVGTSNTNTLCTLIRYATTSSSVDRFGIAASQLSRSENASSEQPQYPIGQKYASSDI